MNTQQRKMRGVANNSRAEWDMLSAKYPGCIITPSYLRLEMSIQNTLSGWTFPILQNEGVSNGTERRLNINDAFCMKDLSVYIMKAGAAVAATQAEIASAVLQTYPNNAVFNAATEAARLMTIYNSRLGIRINSTVWVDSLDLLRFYRVPTAQQGVAVSAVAVTGVVPVSGYDHLNYGYTPLTPNITVGGLAKNEITVTLANPTNLAGTTSQNFAVLHTRGWLIQNGASYLQDKG